MPSDLVIRFGRNTAGRDFVVGDIHGCFDALCEQMDRVQFDPKVDRIFSVGDLVDRGNQSRDAVNWIGQPWFHAVRGNHEQMAIEWAMTGRAMPRDIYAANGGQWFIDLPAGVQQAVAAAFLTLPLVIEVETSSGLVGIVHAQPYGYRWADFVASIAGGDGYVADQTMWARGRISSGDPTPVDGVWRVYAGHTPVKAPVVLGNVHFIDTGAVFGDFGAGLTMVQFAGGESIAESGREVATHGA